MNQEAVAAQQPDMEQNEAAATTTPAPAPPKKQISAQRVLTTLYNLYFSENKPDELQPLDIALLTYLVLRQTEDHFVYDSQDTLGARLGCERKAVKRSIDRLEKTGWISTSVPYQWSKKTRTKSRALAKTIGLSVNLDKLPQIGDRAKRTSAPSEDAVTMAARHTALLRRTAKHGKTRFPKNFKRQQEHAAQRLIDESGGPETAFAVVNLALGESRFEKAARKSLYELRKRLPSLLKAYREQQAAEAADAAASVASPGDGQPRRVEPGEAAA